MKKKFSLLLLVLLTVSFAAACTGKVEPSGSSAPLSVQEQSTPSTDENLSTQSTVEPESETTQSTTTPISQEQTPSATENPSTPISSEPVSKEQTISSQNTSVQSTAESTVKESADTAEEENVHMKLQIGNTVLTATFANNSSAQALKELLKKGPITIEMRDYANMEKVGSLGTTLPRNDEQITTEPGDIILYQGNALVIYYAPNSWDFTRLGKIDHITQDELKRILGDGSVTVTISLE